MPEKVELAPPPSSFLPKVSGSFDWTSNRMLALGKKMPRITCARLPMVFPPAGCAAGAGLAVAGGAGFGLAPGAWADVVAAKRVTILTIVRNRIRSAPSWGP